MLHSPGTASHCDGDARAHARRLASRYWRFVVWEKGPGKRTHLPRPIGTIGDAKSHGCSRIFWWPSMLTTAPPAAQ